MTRFIFLIIFSFNIVAAEGIGIGDVKKVAKIQNPSLSLTFGYPYLNIQDNGPRYTNDFISLSVGALMEFKFDETHSFGIIIDASFTPNRVKFDFEKEAKEVEGTTSLLTSFYSFNYMANIGQTDAYDIIGSIGPTIGIYTLDYTTIEDNETNVSKVNRIRVTNYGVRAGIKWRNRITFNYFEVAAIMALSDKYTLIDDSTNDAEALETIEGISQSRTVGVLFNYGFFLF